VSQACASTRTSSRILSGHARDVAGFHPDLEGTRVIRICPASAGGQMLPAGSVAAQTAEQALTLARAASVRQAVHRQELISNHQGINPLFLSRSFVPLEEGLGASLG